MDLDGITTLFFDLDGTLVDFDESAFETDYTNMVYRYFTDIPQDTFFKFFWQATQVMLKHDDTSMNTLQAYINSFCQLSGLNPDDVEERFKKFYATEFRKLNVHVRASISRKLIDKAKMKGYKIVLATNPVFPEVSTRERMRWAELKFEDFLHVSYAENSTVCKPNPRYYKELLKISGSSPAETLMIGNHYLMDMAAAGVGIKTWMLNQNQLGLEYKGKFQIDFQGSLNNLFSLM